MAGSLTSIDVLSVSILFEKKFFKKFDSRSSGFSQHALVGGYTLVFVPASSMHVLSNS